MALGSAAGRALSQPQPPGYSPVRWSGTLLLAVLGPNHFLQSGPYQPDKSTLGAASCYFPAANRATDGVYWVATSRVNLFTANGSAMWEALFSTVGMQVQIRTNSLEFAQIRSNSNSPRIRTNSWTTPNSNSQLHFESSVIRLIESIGTYNLPCRLQFTCSHMGMPLPSTISHKRFPKSFRNLAIFVVCCCLHLPCGNDLTI